METQGESIRSNSEGVIRGRLANPVYSANKDIELRAAIAISSADRIRELTAAIKENTDRTEDSNRRLIESNESYAYWFKILTGALVIIAAAGYFK